MVGTKKDFFLRGKKYKKRAKEKIKSVGNRRLGQEAMS